MCVETTRKVTRCVHLLAHRVAGAMGNSGGEVRVSPSAIATCARAIPLTRCLARPPATGRTVSPAEDPCEGAAAP